MEYSKSIQINNSSSTINFQTMSFALLHEINFMSLYFTLYKVYYYNHYHLSCFCIKKLLNVHVFDDMHGKLFKFNTLYNFLSPDIAINND